jgi:hypothetical protein
MTKRRTLEPGVRASPASPAHRTSTSIFEFLARAAGAYVTAGSAIQTAAKMSLAVGYIDEWEGDLFIFDSDGNPTTRYVQPQ